VDRIQGGWKRVNRDLGIVDKLMAI
jgi:hypothetical protein